MSHRDDPVAFVRACLDEPLPELLPWQKALLDGKPRRLTVGGGRSLGRRVMAAAMLAEALRTGETVQVHAPSQADADALMAEARRLLEAK